MNKRTCYLIGDTGKTLCACGTCFEEKGYGQLAFFRWWLYYREIAAQMGVDHFVCVNDGSANLPNNRGFDIRHAVTIPTIPIYHPVTILYHGMRLGRLGHLDYPGWWRNMSTLCSALLYGNFERFIWIEWDAFVISQRMMKEIRETREGLVCYWCPRHSFPEGAIFICDRDNAAKVLALCGDKLSGKNTTEAEKVFEWTEVRQNMIGDRYGEFAGAIPAEADYACQWTTDFPYPRLNN